MKSYYLFYFFLIFLISCFAKDNGIKDAFIDTDEQSMREITDEHVCTNIYSITDKIIKKEGISLNKLSKTIYENENYYKVDYVLNDSLSIGGGATIIILKKNMKIISKKFEQ